MTNLSELDQLSAAATELLPCPFCGGPAEVESKRCGWRVHCIKPSCYTAGPYPDDCTEAEAITAWNQRTGQLVAVADDAMAALVRARNTAMHHTLVARIPECGTFGEIAQDLDAALAAMKDAQP